MAILKIKDADGKVQEILAIKGKDGDSLEFSWNGTQLGVKVKGQSSYKYVDLKGQKGDVGDSLEFRWEGTKLGVKTSSQDKYSYVELKGDNSDISLKYAQDNLSNALKGSKSGEAIAITDASPIEHEMGVKVKGKNFVNLSNAYVTSGGEMTIDGTAIALTKKATGNPPSIIFELGAYKDFVGKTLTISFVLDAMGSSGGTNGSAATYIHCGNTVKEAVESVNSISYTSGRVGETITKTFTVPVLDDKGKQLCIRHYMSNGKTEGDYITISNLQIEEGTTATAYAPYVEDISTVKVKRYGKNILPYPYPLAPKTNPHTTNGITFTLNDDRSITISGVATGNAYFQLWNAVLGGKFVGVLTGGTNGDYAFSPYVNYSKSNNNVSLYVAKGTDLSTPVTVYPQIEKGTVATDYEPYIEPIEYPVSVDGTVEGITSNYPTTTLITDTQGAVIDGTYNRDINKAFEELYYAILSTGGTV